MDILRAGAAWLLSTAAAWAQPAIQPGWWEVQHTLRSSSGEMEQAVAEAQRQIAAMPPEQRRMMQEMLGRQGVAMGAGGPPHVFTCISPELAASRALPVQQQGECTTTVTGRAGSTIDLRFVCSRPPSSGTGRFTVHDPRRYSGRWTIVEAAASGRPGERVDIDIEARWVAAACSGAGHAGMPGNGGGTGAGKPGSGDGGPMSPAAPRRGRP